MLTLREFEIYLMIVTRAMSIGQIADHLGLAYSTVQKQQYRILQKMNMGSALELLVQYHRKEAA